MRTYSELTEQEQSKAREHWLNVLLEDLLNGMRFNDKANSDNTQARIDKAVLKAEQMQTPWFASEYIMDDKIVTTVLRAVAQDMAEIAYYLDQGEGSMYLPKENTDD